jgi:hypothetical protein
MTETPQLRVLHASFSEPVVPLAAFCPMCAIEVPSPALPA